MAKHVEEPKGAAEARQLREVERDLARLRLVYPTRGAAQARRDRDYYLDQLRNYLLPRFEQLEAPLIAVIGGSTGAGKSTLLNSLVGREISPASALRPTTRRPVLVHASEDAHWFAGKRLFPGLEKLVRATQGEAGTGVVAAAAGAGGAPAGSGPVRDDAAPTGAGTGRDDAAPAGAGTGRDAATSTGATPLVETVACDELPTGLALLDSPDFDSVVASNRAAADQLLAGADLWVFVTTAARYADKVPWEFLRQAAARNVVIAVVLDRVPIGAGSQVRADLAGRLEQAGLGHAPLFTLTERELEDGLLPAADVASLRMWLQGLVESEALRAGVVRQTLRGAVGELVAALPALREEGEKQEHTHAQARAVLEEELATALREFAAILDGGEVLRGEVLARWHEFVGTSPVFRQLDGWLSRARDRVTSLWRRSDATPAVRALDAALVDALIGTARSVRRESLRRWEDEPVTAELAEHVARSVAPATGLEPRARELVEGWRRHVMEMIGTQVGDKRAAARLAALGVNATGAALLILVFASTGGLLGGEVLVAGGTAAVAQRVLEGIFGDAAVRSLAASARKDFLERATQFLTEASEPIERAVEKYWQEER
ncbi:dynamin family protein [Buchananella felis]|uniref:dynamin family protein n=1 Tax=Buchananella felis TaxID=3231492 RepID=UPI0035288C09